MDKRLLSILCCPVSHKGLSVADRETLGQVNKAISAGELQNHDGHALSSELHEALVTDDGKTLYPVNDGIPVLMAGEAVTLAQLKSASP